ncbi:hypothetical protein JYU34_017018 [Plutella xylostella]|uniref:Uncharacterized protein n=1 Tax=Plutella xylostella TaxID=51655 RepID=A0ABQ7Q440_PLUXY|nr:hypothetical protein JYU34_017018 [Plutella xylostella]
MGLERDRPPPPGVRSQSIASEYRGAAEKVVKAIRDPNRAKPGETGPQKLIRRYRRTAQHPGL